MPLQATMLSLYAGVCSDVRPVPTMAFLSLCTNTEWTSVKFGEIITTTNRWTDYISGEIVLERKEACKIWKKIRIDIKAVLPHVTSVETSYDRVQSLALHLGLCLSIVPSRGPRSMVPAEAAWYQVKWYLFVSNADFGRVPVSHFSPQPSNPGVSPSLGI